MKAVIAWADHQCPVPCVFRRVRVATTRRLLLASVELPDAARKRRNALHQCGKVPFEFCREHFFLTSLKEGRITRFDFHRGIRLHDCQRTICRCLRNWRGNLVIGDLLLRKTPPQRASHSRCPSASRCTKRLRRARMGKRPQFRFIDLHGGDLALERCRDIKKYRRSIDCGELRKCPFR